uniref:Venom carboxylesterase-6 n=1 Tax=Lygus hesperus TaxID=30085 RepID=A0A0A9X1F9_LYGHE
MIECLQQVPANELVHSMTLLQQFFFQPVLVFGPTVQTELPQAFLPDLPYELIRNGAIANVPTLFSCLTNEGLFPVAVFANNDSALSYLDEHWNEVAPFLLDYLWSIDVHNANKTSQAIRNFYLGDQPISRDSIFDLIRMANDRLYLNDIFQSVRWAVHYISSPVYFYRFGYRGATSITNFLSGTNVNWGAGHPDDSFYILNSSLVSMETTARDRRMITIMVGIWGHFITRGVPMTGDGIALTPVNRLEALKGPLNYLWIDSPSYIVPNSSFDFGHTQFFNSLPIDEPFFGRPVNIL